MRDSFDAPLFSVIVPAYNAEDTLQRAIDSVTQQKFDDWELVVVDDGSTDSTPAILASAAGNKKIRTVTQLNQGTASALNAAARASSGKFLVQLGSDDELLPTYFESVSSFMISAPDFDIYAPNSYRVNPDGERELYHQDARFDGSFSVSFEDEVQAPQILGSAAFRRELFEDVGGFDVATYNEDYDFWLRLLLLGAKHIYIPEPLTLYYTSANQKTADSVRVREGDVMIFERLLKRDDLTIEQRELIERRVASIKRNMAFRRSMVSLLGQERANRLFSSLGKVKRRIL